jgi:GTP-binding protein
MGSNKHGRKGKDIILKVPPGTVIKNLESSQIMADLTDDNDKIVAAAGGKGGKGNARFATPTHRAPREWEVGEKGEEKTIILELKLIADVGLVGKPNAGKSTLLSKISAARPKIADYPFTTLTPNLGIVNYQSYKSFVVADIPGLIEGAHQGKGLGLQFLRHIERTNLIAYLIDPTESGSDDYLNIFDTLHNELTEYSKSLIEKSAVIVFTKKDIWSEENLAKEMAHKLPYPVYGISSITGEGLKELKRMFWEESQKATEGREKLIAPWK